MSEKLNKDLGWNTKTMVLFFASFYAIGCYFINIGFGSNGLFGYFFESKTLLKLSLYYILMGHITITAMSLSFHRYHTHKAVKINPVLDTVFQIWLWIISSMSKLEWVSVHIYHHTTSDTEKDPHSPVHKGFWHVFFMGAYDYALARKWPEVLAIAKNIKENSLEKFIRHNLYLGPILLVAFNMVFFGIFYGTILSLLNFTATLFFAVGGVNTVAHWFGYKNYKTKDNSRNIGFIFPMNWIICGELDHNNHHRYPRSASFMHKWYELDVGYMYLKFLHFIHLARIQFAITPMYPDGRSWAKIKESVNESIQESIDSIEGTKVNQQQA